MDLKDIGKLIIFIAICQMAGIVGSVFTFGAIPGWYATLVKPEISPPNWVFGPVWTSLYTLMGIAAYLAYQKSGELAHPAIIAFGGQLVLNTLWSIVFFGLQSPGLAFAVILTLLLAIVLTINLFWGLSKRAAALMVPYLLWVAFASLLNYRIWVLNP